MWIYTAITNETDIAHQQSEQNGKTFRINGLLSCHGIWFNWTKKWNQPFGGEGRKIDLENPDWTVEAELAGLPVDTNGLFISAARIGVGLLAAAPAEVFDDIAEEIQRSFRIGRHEWHSKYHKSVTLNTK